MNESIYLDCKLNATLDFQTEKKRAIEAVAKGLKLYFEIDFGLESHVFKPSEICSFQLALKHFEETFSEVLPHTEMIFVYKGSLEFGKEFGKDQKRENEFFNWLKIKDLKNSDLVFHLFCREKLLTLLKEITYDFSHLPFSLLLDATQVEDPFHFAFLTEKKEFSPFQVLLIGGLPQHETCSYAICLPAFEDFFKNPKKSFENLFHFFSTRKIAYRTLSESCLLTEWHLVDFLFIDSLTPNGKRMAQGFLAAGGTIVTLGSPLNLDGEISFPEFAIQYIK